MKTVYHILNGDCLKEQLKETNCKGEYIICRECLIEGPLLGNTLSQFWKTRAEYISEIFDEATDIYFHKVVSEFEKIYNLPEDAEICLWFENDLFCQVNMWFVISLLGEKKIKMNRVLPVIQNSEDEWKGFGLANIDMLEHAYAQKVELSEQDVLLGINLWEAYKQNDFGKLTELSESESNGFRYLKEVCLAHIDRFPVGKQLGRPERVVKEIMDTKSKNFNDVFTEFSKLEGVYGFGDLQIKRMWQEVLGKDYE